MGEGVRVLRITSTFAGLAQAMLKHVIAGSCQDHARPTHVHACGHAGLQPQCGFEFYGVATSVPFRPSEAHEDPIILATHDEPIECTIFKRAAWLRKKNMWQQKQIPLSQVPRAFFLRTLKTCLGDFLRCKIDLMGLRPGWLTLKDH